MARAIVIGHSHCEAIAQALAEARESFGAISVYRLQDKRPSEHSISLSEACELAADASPDDRIFLSVLHGYHNLLGLVRSGDAFDFFLHPDERPDPDAKVRVPHRAIASAFDAQFEDVDKIRALITCASCPIFLVSAPPPKWSNEFILERFMRPKNRVYRNKVVEDFGVEKAESRLKLWLLEERLMAQWADSLGMRFLPAPPAAFDDRGFLKEIYYDDDVTHANSGYGALVLRQIAEIFESHPRALNG